jgi:ABC-type nitrate/sulfonate/bicarbonate transport system permease component
MTGALRLWPAVVAGLWLLAALALWQGLAAAAGGGVLLAGPAAVAGWIGDNAGLLLRATAVTASQAAAGFVLGNAAGIALAVLTLALPRPLGRLLGGVALVAFCLPFVATGPILRVLSGPGPGPQIVLSALACFYTTYLAVLVGLRAAPAAWFDLVHSYGRGRWTELARVRVRAALPHALAGLQIAAPAAFLGAMVGEFTGAERGLGVLALRTTRALDAAGTWAVAGTAAAVSVAAWLGLAALARLLAVAPAPILLTPPPEPAPARAASLARRGLGILACAVVVLALWHGGMQGAGLNPFFAKRPGDVWAFLAEGPQAAANRATLLAAYGQTLVLALPGYLAGLALGAGLAAAVVLVPGLAAGVMPLAIALRSVPIVTTAPLIVLALGRGATGTITITAVMIFFPTLVACLHGLRQVPAAVGDLFATYAAGRTRRLWHAQVPAALPAFFAAARMGVPAALLAATTTEWLATGIGMGTLMALSASTSAYAMLWSAVALLSATAAAAYLAVEAVERRVLARYGPEQLTR